MSIAPGQRPFGPVLILLLLGLAVALAAASFDSYFRLPLLETGDAAVNALQIDYARHFREIYGNYSRYEFNHPGPAFFYVYAAGEWLFHDLLPLTPSPGNADLLTGMLLQVFFYSLALVLLRPAIGGRVYLPLALVAGACYFGAVSRALAGPGPFLSIWPPHVLLMPFLCFLAAGVSVATGQTRHLPIVVLTGGFLFHGHVAQTLFVGLLGALILLLWWRHARADDGPGPLSRHRTVLLVSAGLAVLFLIPPAIDLLALGRRSNLATILGRFYTNTTDSKSLVQSLLYFLSFGTTVTDQNRLFTELGPQSWSFLSQHAPALGGWLSVLVAPPLLGWQWRERLEPMERRYYATAYGLALAVGVPCLLWGMAIAGDMDAFNGFFYYGLYYFLLLLALALGSRLLAFSPPAPAAVVAGAMALGLFASQLRLPRLSADRNGERIEAGVAAALAADPDSRPKLLVFEHDSWPTAAGVALALQRRGIPFYTNPWWEFMFGGRHDESVLGAEPEQRGSPWWITPPAGDGQAISAELAIHTNPAPLSPTEGTLRFGADENGFRYLINGLTVGNVESASTVLPRLALEFRPEPAERDVRIEFDAATTTFSGKGPANQRAEVRFNGEVLGTVVASTRSRLSVTVPRALWNRDPRAELELRFPDAVEVHYLRRPRYDLWQAWDLWSIRFSETAGD